MARRLSAPLRVLLPVGGYRSVMVQVSDIPDELIALLDERAGKVHSRDGSVLITLAEILTRWEGHTIAALRATIDEQGAEVKRLQKSRDDLRLGVANVADELSNKDQRLRESGFVYYEYGRVAERLRALLTDGS